MDTEYNTMFFRDVICDIRPELDTFSETLYLTKVVTLHVNNETDTFDVTKLVSKCLSCALFFNSIVHFIVSRSWSLCINTTCKFPFSMLFQRFMTTGSRA